MTYTKERKQYSTPIVHYISYKDWYSANVELYTHHHFPNWHTSNNLDRWWDIANIYHRSIYKQYKDFNPGYTYEYIFPDGIKRNGWPKPKMKRKQLVLPTTQEILSECKNILKQSSYYLPTEQITIKVFPRVTIAKDFTNAEAQRLTKTISVYIDGHTGWHASFAETMVHEYFHVAHPRYDKNTLANIMLREGLADGFQEYVLKRKASDRTQYTFKQLKALLTKHRYWLHREVPQSTDQRLFMYNSMTHNVGYQLANLFLNSIQTISWRTITQMSTEEIFHIAQWTLNEKLRKR